MEENKSLEPQYSRIHQSNIQTDITNQDYIDGELIENPPHSKRTYIIAVLLLSCLIGISLYLFFHGRSVTGVITNNIGKGRWVSTGVVVEDSFNSLQGEGDIAIAFTSNGQIYETIDGGRSWKQRDLIKPIISQSDNGVVAVSWGGLVNGRLQVVRTGLENGTYSTIFDVTFNGVPTIIWEGDFGQIYGGNRSGGWLVGTQGLVLHYLSDKWVPEKVSTTSCGTPDYNAIAVKSNKVVLVGTDGRIVRSNDKGVHWTCDKVSAAREPRSFFAIDISDKWEIAGGQKGAFYQKHGNEWIYISGIDDSLSIQSALINGDNGFIGGGRRGYNDSPFIMSSTNNGTTWERETIENQENIGLIVGIVKLQSGYFAITSQGHILKRQI